MIVGKVSQNTTFKFGVIKILQNTEGKRIVCYMGYFVEQHIKIDMVEFSKVSQAKKYLTY
jgi:hypothetical protein